MNDTDQYRIVNTGGAGYPWVVVQPDGTPVGPGAGYGYRTAERAQMEADDLNRADRPDRTAYPRAVERRELAWGGRTSARWDDHEHCPLPRARTGLQARPNRGSTP